MIARAPTQKASPSEREGAPVVPSFAFLHQVDEASRQKLSLCYQCKKCSSGCPLTFAMDYLPHAVLCMVQLGLKERVLETATIWLCASCETCTTRCPNDIDVAGVMDALRRLALEAEAAGQVRIAPAAREIPRFHSAFLSSIRTGGRVHEAGMLGRYVLRADLWGWLRMGRLLKEAQLGWKMFRRGKLKLLPHRMRQRAVVRSLFKKGTG